MAEAGISPSKSEARRAIAEGGAYLNNVKVTDATSARRTSDLLHGRFLVLRRGKRTVGGVEVAALGLGLDALITGALDSTDSRVHRDRADRLMRGWRGPSGRRRGTGR